MRGRDKRSGEAFSYVDLEKRVRADHPRRALTAKFSMVYSGLRRPSISPEMLLRPMLRGLEKVHCACTFAAAAYGLIRPLRLFAREAL